MKILHVAYFGVSGRLNGVAEAVLNLSREIIALGHQNIICTFTEHSIIDSKKVFLTTDVEHFKKVCESYCPDIVAFHSLYEFQQITFSHYLRKQNIPYVLVYHGGASKDNAKKGWLKKKVANFLFWNYFIRNAQRVVYLSKNEEEKSVFRRINKCSCIIPNGANYPEDLWLENHEKLTITFMGRLDYYGKGLDLLFAVIQSLKSKDLSDKLHFAIYGNATDDTPDKIRELEPMAHWYGFINGEAKNNAYKQSDILILPSRSEGMPMCVLEALSFGVPCMVTPETNMAELIVENNCGWRIELDAHNIESTILKALDCLQSSRQEYFERCRTVSRRYSWPHIAQQTIEIYNDVLLKYK